jgi:hypothetical protein
VKQIALLALSDGRRVLQAAVIPEFVKAPCDFHR